MHLPMIEHIGCEQTNPVLESARWLQKQNAYVSINADAVKRSAVEIQALMREQSYSPTIWRQNPMHLPPPISFDPTHPGVKQTLDWIFLISALNFSFWSELEGQPTRYGATWRAGWDESLPEQKWEGYWSLVASLNRALEWGVPIIDPTFYASEKLCPDSLLEAIFQPAEGCAEGIPLLKERIRVMRECGRIFVSGVRGNDYLELLMNLKEKNGRLRAIDVAKLIVILFPAFRDQVDYHGRRLYFWKRAQILIAETWAAFFPEDDKELHPLFPDGVDALTMFADYRVPQILNHLGILEYSPELTKILQDKVPLEYGSVEEMSIRAASICAVDAIKEEMNDPQNHGDGPWTPVTSVLIDFFLWDLAKLVENGEVSLTGPEKERNVILPPHRTRSIYY